MYIRLLEEGGDFDLTGGEGTPAAVVPAEKLRSVLELITVTPWGTDNEEVLATALREVYEKLGLELPTAGRSLLAPKKPHEEKPKKENEYADLVRENHY